jgi:hypothetical protein
MRQWHKQDPKTRTSGQVAVAVITGRPLAQIIERIGHNHHTSTGELAVVLGQYGYLCPMRCITARVLKEVPKLALAQVHSSRRTGCHWVAIEDGRIFDGIWGDAYGVVEWPSDFRITSYLPIEE